MEGVVAGAVIVVVAVLVVALVVGGHHAGQQRKEGLRDLARTRGWTWTDRDDTLAQRWTGPPFRGHRRRAKARHVVSGAHRGRTFTAFEYSYTTTTHTGQTTSTTTHRYSVWVITLPTMLPQISLGTEGAFGGKVAKAFGFAGFEVGDPEFDRQFKVRCDDAEFAGRLLHPVMVDMLKGTGPWEWRIDGDTMLSYRKGRLDADNLVARLDTMCDVVDRIPPELWR